MGWRRPDNGELQVVAARVDSFAPGGRWFGAAPESAVSVNGAPTERLIPKIRSAIDSYRFQAYRHYNARPDPNSNTFIQAVLDTVPELHAVLPPTAIGKDYPYAGRWVGFTPSGTSVFVSIGGCLEFAAGWLRRTEVHRLQGLSSGSICGAQR